MPILILRHEPFEHLGHFAAVLDARGIAYHYHDLGEPFDDEEFDALIIMGGPMSANDDLPGELALIENALKEDVPMLGICLGSQMIAKALGARVYRNKELEIGWETVSFVEPMLGMESPTVFFHWHGDTFDLPEGAQWLAYSEKTRNQAFRWGRKVYGLQFHPEVSAEMIEDWRRQPVNCGDMSSVGKIDARAHDQKEWAERILGSWLDLF